MAIHARATAEILLRLASDRDSRIRVVVAEHPAAPPEALELLASDHLQGVRGQAVLHPRTPAASLRMLVQEPVSVVASNTTLNPSLPEDVVMALSVDELWRCGRIQALLGTLTGSVGEIAQAFAWSWSGTFPELVEAASTV